MRIASENTYDNFSQSVNQNCFNESGDKLDRCTILMYNQQTEGKSQIVIIIIIIIIVEIKQTIVINLSRSGCI